MPQSIVESNTAISQQLVEFNRWVWSGKESPAKATFIPAWLFIPKTLPSEEQYQKFHTEGEIDFTKLIQPVTMQIYKQQ